MPAFAQPTFNLPRENVRNPILDQMQFQGEEFAPDPGEEELMRSLGMRNWEHFGRSAALFDETPAPRLLDVDPAARPIGEAYPFPTPDGTGPWVPPQAEDTRPQAVPQADAGLSQQMLQALAGQQTAPAAAPQANAPDWQDALSQLAQMFQQAQQSQAPQQAQQQTDSDLLNAARYDSIVREASANNAILPLMAAAYAGGDINGSDRRSQRGEFDQLHEQTRDPVEMYRMRYNRGGSSV